MEDGKQELGEYLETSTSTSAPTVCHIYLAIYQLRQIISQYNQLTELFYLKFDYRHSRRSRSSLRHCGDRVPRD